MRQDWKAIWNELKSMDNRQSNSLTPLVWNQNDDLSMHLVLHLTPVGKMPKLTLLNIIMTIHPKQKAKYCQ